MDDDRQDALFELADVVLAVARHIEASKPSGHDGASPLHGAVLRHVDRNPGVTVSELADATRMLSSNASRAVRNLIEAGYLRRVADEVDARRARLYPTAMADQNRTELRTRWGRLLDGTQLDQRSVEALTQHLRRLEQDLSQPPGSGLLHEQATARQDLETSTDSAADPL